MKKILKTVFMTVGAVLVCKGGFQMFHSVLNPPMEHLFRSIDIFWGMAIMILGASLISATIEISEAD